MTREEVENLDNWEVYEEIELHGIATAEELDLITSINGLNEETMNDIIWVRTGYQTFAQWYEDEVGFDDEVV